MKSYAQSISKCNISQIKGNGFSLSGDKKKMPLTYSKSLKSLLLQINKGYDMSGDEFLSKDTNAKYLKTASLTGHDYSANTHSNNTYEYINPSNLKYDLEENSLLYTSTGSNDNIGECAIIIESGKYNFSSHIFHLVTKQDVDKFYLFAFLKSQYCKDYCNILVPKAGIMRRGGKKFLDMQIPYPQQNNSKDIEKLLSILVQNLIDKELNIKSKNKNIDSIIVNELSYSSVKPKKSIKVKEVLKNDFKLSAKFFSSKASSLLDSIKHYKHGYYSLSTIIDGMQSGETPSQYIESENGNVVWLSNSHFRRNIISEIRKIKTNEIKNLVHQKNLIISRRAPAGISLSVPVEPTIPTIINDGLKIISFKKSISQNQVNALSLFLNSSIYTYYIDNTYQSSTFTSITNDDINSLIIPNFPLTIIDNLSEIYFKDCIKINSSLSDYLNNEKHRNQTLGIWQLNMETFEIKKKIDSIIEKIIYNQEIIVSDYLS